MEQVIASDIVKPSSPTPIEFKNHKLSSLDQVGPPVYIPLIFLYENDESKHEHDQISRRLKQSLSEILTIFYPLAGTIKQNSFVDCDDRGAEFVEARVHAPLAQFIQNPKMEELKQLVPVDSSSYDDKAALLLVKTSYFDCGGIAVGVCFAHKIGDTSSFVGFMNAWANTCRGESSRIIPPSFHMAFHIPPSLSTASGYDGGVTKEKIITKRLVFEREKVEELRKRASSDEVKHPSAVEAVSIFIWKCFIEANKASLMRDSGTTTFAASHMVNLRPRAVPKLPDHTFGNCFTFTYAAVSEEEDDDDVDYVSRMRASIREVDDDYINTVVKGEMLFEALEQLGDMLFNPGNCLFTSWRRFPVYDVDFGWGKPVRVCTAPMPYANLVVLMDTPSGDGIEAWINIHDDHFFQCFQANYNKLAVSLIN